MGGWFVFAQADLFSNKPVSKKCGNYPFLFRGRFRVFQKSFEDGLRSTSRNLKMKVEGRNISRIAILQKTLFVLDGFEL
jgi:hypothetical protein